MTGEATIFEALEAHAADMPRALAFAFGAESIAFGALLDDVRRLAGALGARGVGPGERCALVLPNGLDLVRLIVAVQARGGAPVVLNAALPQAALARRLAPLRCRLVVAEPALAAALEAATPADLARDAGHGEVLRPAPEDPAYLQITSGTTGEPRAAVISHRSLAAWIRNASARLYDGRDDVFVGWLPIHHDFGLVNFVFLPLALGRPMHLLPSSIASLRPWLETIARVRGTVTGSPDFGYRIATRTVDPRGLDLGSLRIAWNGAEPVRGSTIAEFERRFGAPGAVRPAYGLAETTLGVAVTDPGTPVRIDAAGHVSCGHLYPGVEVRIAAPDGHLLPAGETGEILVRGQAVFSGYFEDEAGTREVLRDGWLWTGDLGSFDASHELTVRGRRRSLVKRAGGAVFPREVEEAADLVPGVRFSAAIGVPHETLGEDIVVVAEVRDPDAGGAALERAIAESVVRGAGFPPGRVVLIPPRTIPRTASGKLQHVELRRLYLAGDLERRGAVALGAG